jgi:lipopolysaccharide transport system permease protein
VASQPIDTVTVNKEPLSLYAPVHSWWRNRYLIGQMIRREVLERYKGSVFGLVWSFAHPLLMLLVYMFVFGIVFKMRWGVEQDNNMQFAIVLFAGLIVHALFAECLVRAPSLILSNKHLVTKVVFPLETLIIVSTGTALFHMAVSIVILLSFLMLTQFSVHWTIVFLPVVLLPLIMMSMGVSWFVASLAVFLRDIAQIVGILSTVLLFLSAVFYPLSAVPEALRPYLYVSPLTLIIEEVRKVVI